MADYNKEFIAGEGLSEDKVVDGELAHASAEHVIARIERVMRDLAGVAEWVHDDCDP
jgi:hypothetical protein